MKRIHKQVVRPLQEKTSHLLKTMRALSVSDAQMAVIDLQHEIGFVVRLHNWTEADWQYRHLTESIQMLEDGLEERMAPPPPPPTLPHSPKKENTLNGYKQALAVVTLTILGLLFAVSPIGALAFLFLLVFPVFFICWAFG